MQRALTTRWEDLRRATDRLCKISAHDALVILRSSLSAPKLLHTLRSAPFNNPTLTNFDSLLKAALSKITNNTLSECSWGQASLPIRDGGLGIRSVVSLAPSAFLASAASTRGLQTLILRLHRRRGPFRRQRASHVEKRSSCPSTHWGQHLLPEKVG